MTYAYVSDIVTKAVDNLGSRLMITILCNDNWKLQLGRSILDEGIQTSLDSDSIAREH